MDETKSAIIEYLRSKNFPPTRPWLENFLSTVRSQPSLLAQQKTAHFRILASDLTSSVDASAVTLLPRGISDPQTQERRLSGPVTVQVLDIEDIGRSRWSQVEAIEAHERGETTKGREIIRSVPDETGDSSTTPSLDSGLASAGPHKLQLQDAAGTKVYAVEMERVTGLGVQKSIGSKLILRNLLVARGVVLLVPAGVELLGGKVDAWDRKWREDRKETLKSKAGMNEGDGQAANAS